MKKARRPPSRLGWMLSWLGLGVLLLTALPGSIPRLRAARADPVASPTENQGPPRLDLAAAWGAPPVQRLPTQIDKAHRFVFGDAVTADGHWLIGSIEPRLIFAATNDTPVVALYNIETRALVRLHAMRTPRSQLLGAAADGEWVVWSEATDALRTADWSIFAFNQRTSQISQLAQAERVNGAPIEGAMPYPAMDHGLLLWAQEVATASPKGEPGAIVRVKDMATGAVTTLGTGMDPGIAWPWVYWRDEPAGSGVITALNLKTQQIMRTPDGAESLALSGVSLVICHTRSLDLVENITRRLNSPKRLLSVTTPNHLQDVSISGRLIAWEQVGPSEVWDRLLHVVVQLPIRSGQSATWTHGDTLVWIDPEPPETQRQDIQNNLYPTPDLDVIDVSTLPTKLAA